MKAPKHGPTYGCESAVECRWERSWSPERLLWTRWEHKGDPRAGWVCESCLEWRMDFVATDVTLADYLEETR